MKSHVQKRLWSLWLIIVVITPVLPALWKGNIVGQDERIGDRANTLWLHWYATHDWSWGQEFGVTDVFLYPEGVDLWAELFNVVDAFVSIPFVWIFGWGAHYTWMVLILLGFNLWAAQKWASIWTKQWSIAWLSALVWMGGTSVWNSIEAGRLVQTMVGVLPLSMWGLHRLRLDGRWKSGVLAGLSVGIAGSLYLYWGYGLFFLALLWCPWRVCWKKSGWWTFAVVAGGFALWNLLQVDSGYLQSQMNSNTSFPPLSQAFTETHFDSAGSILESALPIGWMGFSSNHSLSVVFVLFLMFGIFNSLALDKSFLLCLIGGSFFIILGMGPYWMTDNGMFDLNGTLVQSPIYLWMYENVPLIARMHWPNRWLPIIGVLMMPLMIQGIVWCNKKVSTSILMILVPFLIGTEVLLRGTLPLSDTQIQESQCYLEVAKVEPDQPILLLPFVHSSRAAVYQPIHLHPIINPISVSYEPERWGSQYQENLQSQILQWAQSFPNSNQVKGLKTSADEVGISHIIYHKEYLGDALHDPKAPNPIQIDDDALIKKIHTVLGASDCSDELIEVWTIGSL